MDSSTAQRKRGQEASAFDSKEKAKAKGGHDTTLYPELREIMKPMSWTEMLSQGRLVCEKNAHKISPCDWIDDASDEDM